MGGVASDIGRVIDRLDCLDRDNDQRHDMHESIHLRFRPLFRPRLLQATSGLMLALGLSFAGAATTSKAEIETQYQRDRAVCLSGKSNQDQATCLKEAGAARAEALRGDTGDGGADYRRNQLDRCKALAGDEARDCRLRMQGAGKVSGSASAGGIYRELTTVEPAPAASAASAP